MDINLDYGAIGRRVKAFRKERNLTQEGLAEIVDLTPAYISNIENNHTQLSLPAIIAIANALRTSVDHLLFDQTTCLSEAYDLDAKLILDDCTESERFILLENMKSLKKTLRNTQ